MIHRSDSTEPPSAPADLPETLSSATPRPSPELLPFQQLSEQLSGQLLEKDTVADLWVPSQTRVNVAGYDLPGMIYVGEQLAGVNAPVGMEPCLIRPQLKVNRTKPDRLGHWLSRWPSYSEIPSSCRAAYLQWLATGRRDPEIAIGYVYLFFYGLERRVLRDLHRAEQSWPELQEIMTEVEQLSALYGDHDSFAKDAQQFLEIVPIIATRTDLPMLPPLGHRLPRQQSPSVWRWP
ncbi:MAG: hypothetical protein HC934_07980 [Acaryochloridaceae cyanobacterium SU_2_1]|nr:hypothetical protein [Acaryochloridaceae cyanobacterium SU_2_1]